MSASAGADNSPSATPDTPQLAPELTPSHTHLLGRADQKVLQNHRKLQIDIFTLQFLEMQSLLYFSLHFHLLTILIRFRTLSLVIFSLPDI